MGPLQIQSTGLCCSESSTHRLPKYRYAISWSPLGQAAISTTTQSLSLPLDLSQIKQILKQAEPTKPKRSFYSILARELCDNTCLPGWLLAFQHGHKHSSLYSSQLCKHKQPSITFNEQASIYLSIYLSIYCIACIFHGAKFSRNHDLLYYRKFSWVKFLQKQMTFTKRKAMPEMLTTEIFVKLCSIMVMEACRLVLLVACGLVLLAEVGWLVRDQAH